MADYKLICGFCQHYNGKQVGFCHKDTENKIEALANPQHYRHHCHDGSIENGLVKHLVFGGNSILTDGDIVPDFEEETI